MAVTDNPVYRELSLEARVTESMLGLARNPFVGIFLIRLDFAATERLEVSPLNRQFRLYLMYTQHSFDM